MTGITLFASVPILNQVEQQVLVCSWQNVREVQRQEHPFHNFLKQSVQAKDRTSAHIFECCMRSAVSYGEMWGCYPGECNVCSMFHWFIKLRTGDEFAHCKKQLSEHKKYILDLRSKRLGWSTRAPRQLLLIQFLDIRNVIDYLFKIRGKPHILKHKYNRIN